MQGLFWVVALPYGFSWDGAKTYLLTVPIKPSRGDTSLVEVGDRDTLADLDLGRFPYDIRDTGVG